MDGLKHKTIRGSAAKLTGQITGMAIRLGTLIVLARLLEPADFGLVAMVTVITGTLEIFQTGGLSAATIQREKISHEQVSALFWINLLIGAALSLLCLASAPLILALYNEPRTTYVLAAIAPAFVLNASGVQHLALLQRDLRYVTLSGLEAGSQLLAGLVAIAMALNGWGYWAVVASVMVPPLALSLGGWIASGWLPGPPRRASEIGALVRFGGTITLNNLIIYVAYNFEKVLLGRYFGADVLGLYGRAYQLVNLPTQTLNAAVGSVAFSALSRLQTDPPRFKSYFLKGYSLVVSATLPITLFCLVAAEDITVVVLGEKWLPAAEIFRLLAPTILVFAVINPLAWLLQATGRHKRSLYTAMVIAPLVITAYLIGLPYGPKGVALAYSVAMVLFVVPCVYWCLAGTPVTPRELFAAVGRALASGVAAAGAALLVQPLLADVATPVFRLLISGGVLAGVYGLMLLVVLGQAHFYRDVLRGVLRPT